MYIHIKDIGINSNLEETITIEGSKIKLTQEKSTRPSFMLHELIDKGAILLGKPHYQNLHIRRIHLI